MTDWEREILEEIIEREARELAAQVSGDEVNIAEEYRCEAVIMKHDWVHVESSILHYLTGKRLMNVKCSRCGKVKLRGVEAPRGNESAVPKEPW